MSAPYKNYIGGTWCPPKLRRYFKDTNPANTRISLGEFPQSSPDDINEAVQAAHGALRPWRRIPAPKRGELIGKLGSLLERDQEKIARAITEENGKILREAHAEVREAVKMADFIAAQARLLGGRTYPSGDARKICLTLRHPVGVCGLITPWNFPVIIAGWKLFPALICGNTVVLKPAEDTPLSAHLFVELAIEAGIPPGVLNLVHGTGEEAGRALVRHPGVDLISFTGSSNTGREVAEACGKTLKRCSLEMGGKNAQIILKDAQLERAAQGALWGAYGTSGQRCTATSRIIVEKSVLSKFTEIFLDQVKQIQIGNGLNKNTQLGPLINEAQRKRVHGYMDIANKEGAEILQGGKHYEEGACGQGLFYEPTVLNAVTPSMRVAQEEIFGPVACLMGASGLDEAITILNDTRYGLSASLYTQDITTAMQALEDFETGIIYINCPTVGAEVHMPFGGLKNTGNGHRECGQQGLDIFSEWKSAYIDYSAR